MHNCSCENPLVPGIVEVVKIIDETPDIKNFYVRSENGVPFNVMPGQLAMVSLVPVGEGMFSVSWQEENDHLEFAIKRTGLMTDELHKIEVGQKLECVALTAMVSSGRVQRQEYAVYCWRYWTGTFTFFH